MAYYQGDKMKVGKMNNIAYMAEITKLIILGFKIRIENTSWKN
jgi:hypothetical protein